MSPVHTAEVVVAAWRCRNSSPLPRRQSPPRPKENLPVPAVVDFWQEYWSAERCTEFVTDQMGSFGERVLTLSRDTEAAVAPGLEDRTVDLVGAAFGDHDGARRTGQFSARNGC